MKWFVTGGAGFIGSHFIEHIFETEPESEVVCYDLLTYAANVDFAQYVRKHPRGTLIAGDICNGGFVQTVLSHHRPDIVVNFAAESHVDNSYSQPHRFVQTNISGVVTLLDAMRDTGSQARFVQISTDEVYGDDPLPHDALSRLSPQNPYAATKAAAEFMVNSYTRSFYIDSTIVRSSNNWGPRQHREKFIPAALHAKDTGVEMVVHGYDLSRDWLYVRDNARAIYELSLKPGEGPWVIATGEQYFLSEVLDRIGDVPHRVSPERPGVDMGYSVDPTTTWEVLGWEPEDFMQDARWESYVAGTTVDTETVREVREAV